jgi:hypothetical protein
MQLQELFGCATRGELYSRFKSGANYVRWLVYLERKEELENERLKALIGEQP